MSRVLYFDCFSGISGDMTLGALLDAGLPFDDLKRALGSLALGDAHIHATRVLRTGVSATKFSVHAHTHDHSPHSSHDHEHPSHQSHDHDHGHSSHHPHRSLPEIFTLIDGAALSPGARDRAKAMFQRLGEAEAAIHQMPVNQVHLHEVGSLDSIIDIVGTVFAMEWAGADRTVCSPLNVGGGMVTSAHGVFPVPAPATLRLLGDAPVYSGAVQKELVTPTGALIATTFASSFGPIPAMTVERVGYGAGDRDDPVTPNVLRVLIGEETAGLKACPTPDTKVAQPGASVAQGLRPDTNVAQGLRPDTNVAQGLRPDTNVAQGLRSDTSVAQGFRSDTSVAQGLRSDTSVAQGLRSDTSVAQGFRPDTNVAQGLRPDTNVAQGFSPAGDRVTVIECEIDDMNPQIFGVVMDRLYAAGALEVFYIPVQMKKNRPGTLLTVVAAPDLRAQMTDVIFRETTTIGLRHHEMNRECLERAIVTVETPIGPVRFKVASRDGRVLNATPEFEDCSRLAVANDLPVKEVQALALKAYRP